jgi:WD40 repeat protein
LWDATDGRPHAELNGPPAPTRALAFSADSALLASAARHSPDVWLWGVPSGAPALLIPGAADDGPVEALAFAPCGHVLSIGSGDGRTRGRRDGRVALWDVDRRKRLAVLPGGAVAAAFDPAGRRLATASPGQRVRLWDVENRSLIAEWAAHGEAVACVAFSPDGRLLATGGDDRAVRLWDADAGFARGGVELDTQIKALVFSPDGRRLFTANGNGGCYRLDVERILEDAVS